MQISLSPELERLVAERIAEGMYDTPDALVQAALTEFFEAERFTPEEAAEIDRKIAEGIADIEAGNFLTADESKAQIRALLKDLPARRK